MALEQNLTIDQGSLFQWDFFVRTDKTTIFDLTGYQARGQIRKSYDTSTVLITPTFTVSVPLGKITMTVPPATSTAVVFSGEELECVYDIEIYTTGDADVKRIVEGVITLVREVTRV